MKSKSLLSPISILVILFLMLGFATGTQAAPPAQAPDGDPQIQGPDIWTQHGPTHQLAQGQAPGVGVIRFDPTNPNTVFAGSNQGVYRSLDAGMHWSPRSNGLGGYGDLVITDIEFDPTNAQTMFISTWGYGIFKSIDAGANWARITDPLAGVSMAAPGASGEADPAASDPNLPDIRRVGMQRDTEIRALNQTPQLQAPGKSPSGMPQHSGLPAVPVNLNWTAVRNIAINPSNRLEMYAAISAHGIRRSTDGGMSWSDYLVNGTDSGWDFQFAPSNINIRYISMASGVYRSTDGGTNWLPVGSGVITGLTFEIAIHPTNPNIVMASANDGLYRTSDGGGNWVSESTESSLADSFYLSTTFAPNSPSTVYASAFSCVYRSLDAGATWGSLNCSIPPYYLYSPAVQPTDSTYLLVGGDDFPMGGVYYVNGSSGAHSVASTGMDNTYVLDIEQDPLISSTLYAATWGAGIFRSTDSGNTWAPINSAYAPYVYCLEAAVSGGSVVLYAGTFYVDYGILKSTDRGTTWTEVSNTYPSNISFDLETIYGDANYLVAATVDGVQVSLDGGATWNTPYTLSSGVVLKITESGSTGRMLAATYGGGIYSSWGGSSWFEANSGITGANTLYTFDVEFSATQAGTAYAGTNRIFVTSDYGENWGLLNAGLPSGEYVRSLAVSASGVTLAGLQNKGVYYMTGLTDIWQPLNNGLTAQNIRSLLINSATQRIYAGTNGSNVWDYQPSTFPASKKLFLPTAKRSWATSLPASDPYELNNTFGTATNLSNPGEYYANITSTLDHDWYRIAITQLGPVTVQLLDVPPGTDYDLEVYSDTGLLLSGSYYDTGMSEQVDFIPNKTMNLYIHVMPYGTTLSPEFYRLKLSYNGARGSGSIYGNVKFFNANAANQPVTLYYYNGYRSRQIVTQTDNSGNYTFPGMAALPPGHRYFVRYDNPWSEPNKLAYFECYYFTGYVAGENRNACNFDIGNISLNTPASGQMVTIPVRFNWYSRGVSGDTFRVILYDDNFNLKYSSAQVSSTYFDLAALPSGMSFSTHYLWAVRVNTTVGLGYSYYVNGIYFSSGAGTPDLLSSDPLHLPLPDRIEQHKGLDQVPPPSQ